MWERARLEQLQVSQPVLDKVGFGGPAAAEALAEERMGLKLYRHIHQAQWWICIVLRTARQLRNSKASSWKPAFIVR